MLAYACTIFLSAFLLFAVQPMIGKMILPWFGGSAAVWSTCLLFFQAALLAGYLYAHWSTRSLKPRYQAALHVTLMLASFALLRLPPSTFWKPEHAGDPTGRILLLLTACIGLPYLLLSTTSPLLQAWYVAAKPGAVPYRLFALSNFGSLLALVSYPALFEPTYTTHLQGFGWSGVYAAFVVICAIVAWTALRTSHQPPNTGHPAPADSPQPPTASHRLLWTALAACSTSLLLAITNHMSQNVAPIPFLWVLPLGLYLITFILCFESEKIYHRAVFLPLLAIALGAAAYTIYTDDGNPNVRWAIPVFAGALFVACMVCHGELVRLKPDPRHLTTFYMMISLGGALGGLFVAIAAPHIFHSYAELPLSLIACPALAALVLWISPGMANQGESRWPLSLRWTLRIAAAVLVAALAVYVIRRFVPERPDRILVGGCALIVILPWLWPPQLRGRNGVIPSAVAALALTLGLAVYLGYEKYQADRGFRISERNFYGVLRVRDVPQSAEETAERRLIHGTINHGTQLLDPKRKDSPTSYYGPFSGMGRAMQYFQSRGPARIGVIGLGAGVTASFCRAGDVFRFYEINPLTLAIASSWFTFLQDCKADHQVLLGDARLTMEAQPSQQFDMLAVDAFTSDAIPVHLLTREAFALYFRHLQPHGILAVHVSNRYLDLVPVVARNARDLGKSALDVDDDDEEADYFSSSDWVLVTADPSTFKDQIFNSSSATPARLRADLRPWTDDYSNLFQILKTRED